MPRFAFVNGSYIRHNDATIHIEDRGLQFSDSVYEVIAFINGKMADETGHIDRLERSLSELGIHMPVTRNGLKFIMRELLRRNRLRNAMIYIQVSRGATKRDFEFPQDIPSSLIITARLLRYDSSVNVKNGVTVITVPDLRWKRRDIKTTMLLGQVLAKQEAIESGAYDAWMVDEDGFVTEASASNAWIVTKDGTLVTRNVTTDILRGVTRTALEKITKDLNIKFEERPFTPEEAYEGQEAFNTAASALIVPVISVNDHVIGTGKPGPITRKIYDEYRAYADGQRGQQIHWKAGLQDDLT